MDALSTLIPLHISESQNHSTAGAGGTLGCPSPPLPQQGAQPHVLGLGELSKEAPQVLFSRATLGWVPLACPGARLFLLRDRTLGFSLVNLLALL